MLPSTQKQKGSGNSNLPALNNLPPILWLPKTAPGQRKCAQGSLNLGEGDPSVTAYKHQIFAASVLSNCHKMCVMQPWLMTLIRTEWLKMLCHRISATGFSLSVSVSLYVSPCAESCCKNHILWSNLISGEKQSLILILYVISIYGSKCENRNRN